MSVLFVKLGPSRARKWYLQVFTGTIVNTQRPDNRNAMANKITRVWTSLRPDLTSRTMLITNNGNVRLIFAVAKGKLSLWFLQYTPQRTKGCAYMAIIRCYITRTSIGDTVLY